MFDIHIIVQNNDWLTQLNLTILDNVQQPLANPDSSITSLNNQTSIILFRILFNHSDMIPLNTSFADSLRIYFENYGDPGDFARTAMISFVFSLFFLSLILLTRNKS